MIALLCFFLALLVSPFHIAAEGAWSHPPHERGSLVLRPAVSMASVLNTITIIRPETLVRWHRAGFRLWCTENLILG
jgi:hypothetical protein